MKNIFFILAFSLLLITGCQYDEDKLIDESQNTAAQGRFKVVDYHSIPNIMNHIAWQHINLLPVLEQQMDVTSNDNPFGTIDLNMIRQVIFEDNPGHSNYTFAITPHEHVTGAFANLVVVVQDGVIIRSYINNYIPTVAHILDYGLTFNEYFTGQIKRYTLEDIGADGSTTSFTGNDGTDNVPPVSIMTLENGGLTNVSLTSNCDDGDGAGNTGDPMGNDGDTTGSGTGSGGGASSGGSSGGSSSTSGSPNPFPDSSCDIYVNTVEYCCNAPDIFIDVICSEANNEQQFTSSSYNQTTTTTNTDPCSGDDVVVINPPEDPCTNTDNKITALNAIMNNEPFKTKLQNLLNDTGGDVEKGVEFNLTTTGWETQEFVGDANGIQFPDPTASTYVTMHMHHDGLFPFFSAQDIIESASMFLASGSPLPVSILVTSQNLYAFVANNETDLNTLMNRSGEGQNYKDFIDVFNRITHKDAIKQLGCETDPTQCNQEELFNLVEEKIKNFMAKGNTGMKYFKAVKQPDGTYIWECIN